MMKNVTVIFVLFILAGVSESVAEIRFEGAPPANQQNIEYKYEQLLNEHQPLQTVVDSLNLWLADEGYLDAAVIESEGSIVIDAGPHYRIARLIIHTVKTDTLETDVSLTKKNLEDLLRLQLERYYDSGYYYSQLTIRKIEAVEASIEINVRLTPGPTVTIDKNIFAGLKRTRPEIISKYLRINSGDTLTTQSIQLAQRSASSIPFIRFEPPVSVRPLAGYNRADLIYNFREQKQFLFSGGGGYIPDDPTGLVWQLDLKLRNLFGQGRQISIYSERREQKRNLLNVHYTQPAFLLGIDQLSLAVATRNYRDEFYEFGLEADYNTLITEDLTTGLTLNWKRVEPELVTSPGYSRFGAGFNLKRQLLENPLNPIGGFYLDWHLEYAYRKYSDDTLFTDSTTGRAFNETRTELAVDFYRQLPAKIVFHLGLNYRGLESGEDLPPISELFFVGGPGTIRGFRNDQFVAQRTAFGTLEPRLRFNRGYFFLFYDAAYLNYKTLSTASILTTEELYRNGYGGGVALIGGDKFLRLSLGWNPDSPLNQPRLSIELASDI